MAAALASAFANYIESMTYTYFGAFDPALCPALGLLVFHPENPEKRLKEDL